MVNLDLLPNNAQLTIKELATSLSKNQRGITRLSASQIRRLEAKGFFPASRKITGTRCTFYLAGEVKAWLLNQANNFNGKEA